MLSRRVWFWWGLTLSVPSAANMLLTWLIPGLLTIAAGLAVGRSLRRRVGQSRQQWTLGLALFVYAPLCVLVAWKFVAGLDPAVNLAQLHLRCAISLIVMCLNVPDGLLGRKDDIYLGGLRDLIERGLGKLTFKEES